MPNPTPPTLNYASFDPVPRRLARRLWWAILIACIAWLGALLLLRIYPLELNEHFGFGISATPAAPVNFNNKPDYPYSPFAGDEFGYQFHVSIYLVVLLLTQWLFLVSRGSLRIRLNLEGRPMKRSAIAAGFVAMLLSAGLLAVLLEWPFPQKIDYQTTTLWARMTVPKEDGGQHFGLFWLAMAILWIAWAFIFWRYGRSLDRHTALTRILRFLFAGTILELLVSVPVHAWIARKEDCYCARGSYTGVVFGLTALFWLFGPGLFLLFLREKRRLERAVKE